MGCTGMLRSTASVVPRVALSATAPGRSALRVAYSTALPPAGTRTVAALNSRVAPSASTLSGSVTSLSVVLTICTGNLISSPASRNPGTTGST